MYTLPSFALHFEKDVLRPIPLVQQFFHEVILTTQPETNRTLIPFVAGVADSSTFISASRSSSNFRLARRHVRTHYFVHQIGERTPRRRFRFFGRIPDRQDGQWQQIVTAQHALNRGIVEGSHPNRAEAQSRGRQHGERARDRSVLDRV